MEDNLSFDLILQQFKCYEVTMDNINSLKKRKDKINLQRYLANKLSSANPLIIQKSIDNWLCLYVESYHRMRKPLTQFDWTENSLQ